MHPLVVIIIIILGFTFCGKKNRITTSTTRLIMFHSFTQRRSHWWLAPVNKPISQCFIPIRMHSLFEHWHFAMFRSPFRHFSSISLFRISFYFYFITNSSIRSDSFRLDWNWILSFFLYIWPVWFQFAEAISGPEIACLFVPPPLSMARLLLLTIYLFSHNFSAISSVEKEVSAN